MIAGGAHAFDAVLGPLQPNSGIYVQQRPIAAASIAACAIAHL